MEFRPYIVGDLEQIFTLDVVKRFDFTVPFDTKITTTSAWTGIEGGQVMGCGGFNRFWNGVYEAWVIAKSPEIFQRYKIGAVRFIKKRIKELPAHRIQATIAADSILDNKFVQHLGFRFDTILDWYGPGKENYYLYSLVK